MVGAEVLAEPTGVQSDRQRLRIGEGRECGMTRTIRVGFSLAVAAVVLMAGWVVSTHGVTAGNGPAVAIDSATTMVGDTTTVDLTALDMADPGLGAWSINVIYDPGVLEADGCSGDNGSVCNPTFAADTVRISGATAMGMPGDSLLASIGFRCTQLGSSSLTVTVDTLADGTPGDPQDIDAAIINGSITCQEAATPTDPPPPPTPDNNTGGNNDGFPAAGGTYWGEVPGEGSVTVVIEPNGQGIQNIWVNNLVTVCGTVNQVLTFDPPLDIDEPGFSFVLFAFSEGGAYLSIEGTFAENGTIPVNLIIDTSNEDFPGGASPCLSENQVIPLVLVRQSAPPPPPPSGGSYVPPPSGGGSYTSGGGSLPNAGSGPGLGIDAQNPVTWLVAAMIGAGVAWLSAGLAGAGLTTATSSVGVEGRTSKSRGFTPSMQPVRHASRPVARVEHKVKLSPREAPVVDRPRTKRGGPEIGPGSTDNIGAFTAPKRPDRR